MSAPVPSPADPEPTRAAQPKPSKSGLIALGVLIAVLVAGSLLRTSLGIEWSAASVRQLVDGFGIWGPLIFTAILALRVAMLIPSPILLTAAGLCFGALAGAIYGTLGLSLSALLNYGMVRWAGAESMSARVPRRYRGALELARSKAGAGALAAASGYPVGPMTIVQLGAAATGMALGTFVIAVAAGSAVRAATYSIFGSSLVEGEGLLLSALLLGAAVGVPLALPGPRAWLRQILTNEAEERDRR